MQALARSVYARCSLVILDDVLSALDANTARHIVESLIGPNGLFKKLGTTVVLITHASKSFPETSCVIRSDKISAAQHLCLADQFIVLGERGQIVEQGISEDLPAKASYFREATLGSGEKVDGTVYDNQAGDREKARGESQAPTNQRQSNMQDDVLKTGDITIYGKLLSY